MNRRSLGYLRVALLALTVTAACEASGPVSASAPNAPTASPSTSVEITKAPFSQPPLAAPTHVRWAIDHADQPNRHLFEVYFDRSALGFRVVDATGRQIVVLPIAGSGIFGPETCMAAVRAADENATWVSVDEPAYQDLLAHGSSYRVEVETIGHGTITLPMVDSGCRRA